MQKVLKAAREMFGEVMQIKKRNGAYECAIKRDKPTFADAPYMFIRARVSNPTFKYKNDVEFYWGHYDLTIDRLNEELLARA